MTEGQLRYQTLQEDRRHNMAMEKYSKTQAEASALTAQVKSELAPYEMALMTAQKGQATATGARNLFEPTANAIFKGLSFVLPTADTVVKTIGSLFS